MLDMPFDDESFDFVVANHVLEHVNDDLRALSEIRRVLKTGGHAILQTPFCYKLHKTWQDTGIDNDYARLQAYGQKDHLRLFGRDIFERIVAAGFESCVQAHEDVLPEVNPLTAGINAREPFFLFRRVG
jgi:ubiquinone/menaquinone biosynthesis C-methylase UbiE